MTDIRNYCKLLDLKRTINLMYYKILDRFKKYKTFSVLIYSYINTSGNWKNEKLRGNTTPAGRSVFTQFQIFTSVDITVYQHGKNVLYFFYNIAQRTLTEVWREIFRVDIELYINTALSQSAFRIYKCYIIKSLMVFSRSAIG